MAGYLTYLGDSDFDSHGVSEMVIRRCEAGTISRPAKAGSYGQAIRREYYLAVTLRGIGEWNRGLCRITPDISNSQESRNCLVWYPLHPTRALMCTCKNKNVSWKTTPVSIGVVFVVVGWRVGAHACTTLTLLVNVIRFRVVLCIPGIAGLFKAKKI